MVVASPATSLQDENGVLVSSLPSPQSLSAQRSGKRRYWFKNGKNSQFNFQEQEANDVPPSRR
jgi:hypothetical protein